MLAIYRALRVNPDRLLLDESSQRIVPKVVIVNLLKKKGFSNLTRAVSHRCDVIDDGRIGCDRTAKDVDRKNLKGEFLGIWWREFSPLGFLPLIRRRTEPRRVRGSISDNLTSKRLEYG